MQAMNYAQVDDVGVQLVVQVVDQSGAVIDVSSATALKIKLGYPDRITTADKTASLFTDGTDGKIVYATIAGDLSQDGLYYIQGEVTLSGAPVSTRKGTLQVFSNVDNT